MIGPLRPLNEEELATDPPDEWLPAMPAACRRTQCSVRGECGREQCEGWQRDNRCLLEVIAENGPGWRFEIDPHTGYWDPANEPKPAPKPIPAFLIPRFIGGEGKRLVFVEHWDGEEEHTWWEEQDDDE